MRLVIATALAFSVAAHAAAENLEICVEGAYPPFSWTNDDGEVEGFDIDIARALCDEIGATCVLETVEWDGIIPALETDLCDAIVASMGITEARRQRVDFTEKYQQTPIRLVARDGAFADDDPATLADAKICIQRGSVHQQYLEDNYPDARAVLYPTQDEAFLDLSFGRCDAVMADELAITLGFLDSDDGDGYAIFGRNHLDARWHGEGGGIAVRKSDAALRDRLSAAIRAIRANGVYKDINDRYFPFDVYGD